jgi:mannose-6-phosphate isomerase-like protein (cupin superfamily)
VQGSAAAERVCPCGAVQQVEQLVGHRGCRPARGQRLDGAAARVTLGQRARDGAGRKRGQRQAVHEDHRDACGGEGLGRRQVVELVLLENITAPDGGPPPHIHEREDEFFYVIDGAFEIRIGDETHAVGPGGFAFVPRGTVHCFRNTTEAPARILVGFTPGAIDGFFREAGVPAVDDGPAPAFGPEELARTELAAPKYGLSLAGG